MATITTRRKVTTLILTAVLAVIAAAVMTPQADAASGGIEAQTAIAWKHSRVSDRRIMTVASGLNGDGRRDFLSRGEWSNSRADGSSIASVSSAYVPAGCALWVKVGVLPYVRWANERTTGRWSNYTVISPTAVGKLVC